MKECFHIGKCSIRWHKTKHTVNWKNSIYLYNLSLGLHGVLYFSVTIFIPSGSVGQLLDIEKWRNGFNVRGKSNERSQASTYWVYQDRKIEEFGKETQQCKTAVWRSINPVFLFHQVKQTQNSLHQFDWTPLKSARENTWVVLPSIITQLSEKPGSS